MKNLSAPSNLMSVSEGNSFSPAIDFEVGFPKANPLVAEISGADAAAFKSISNSQYIWSQPSQSYLNERQEPLVLRFLSETDFESPLDQDRDNRYDITLKVSTTDGTLSSTVDWTIEVIDLPEAIISSRKAANIMFVKILASPCPSRASWKRKPILHISRHPCGTFQNRTGKRKNYFSNNTRL